MYPHTRPASHAETDGFLDPSVDEREIFARRAMVDQARECLRYQRKT